MKSSCLTASSISGYTPRNKLQSILNQLDDFQIHQACVGILGFGVLYSSQCDMRAIVPAGFVLKLQLSVFAYLKIIAKCWAVKPGNYRLVPASSSCSILCRAFMHFILQHHNFQYA